MKIAIRSTSVLVVAACLQAGAASAVTLTPALLRLHTGQAEFEHLGTDVAALGDVNGDGVRDYIVGAPGHNGNDGRAIVYSGATFSPLHILTGPTGIFQRLGESVAGAGPIDADAFADTVSAGTGGLVGTALAHSGATGALLYPFSPSVIGNFFGISVAGGDVNGDGVGDVLVGEPGCFNTTAFTDRTGCVHTFSGATGTLLHTVKGPPVGLPTAPYQFGYSVATVGDLNGNGTTDYVVGAPDFDTPSAVNGRARIYDGATGVLDVDFHGAGVSRAALLGDVDGDGAQDLAVPGFAEVRVISTSTGAPLYGFAYPGGSLPTLNYDPKALAAGIGDFDGNGVPDLVVGDPLRDTAVATNAGAAHVLDGDTGTIRYTLEGASPDDHFGEAVAALGDLNGDGYVEFAVGAPDYDGGIGPLVAPKAPARDIGAVYVYSLVPPCVDADSDGYGTGVTLACPIPGVADCDDGNPAVHPGAVEIPGNGIDDDCNAATPGGCTPPTTVAVDGPSMQVAAALAPYLVPVAALAALGARRRRVRR